MMIAVSERSGKIGTTPVSNDGERVFNGRT